MLVNLNGILARHIMKQLLVPFLCCFFGFLFLFFIGDLQDELGDMLKEQGHSFFEVAQYFLFILPEKIPLIAPMALLLGTMYCFSNLNRHNEINAIRSSGVSIFRMSLPVVAFSLFMSLMLFMTNEYMQGYFSERASQLHEKITGEKSSPSEITFIVREDNAERHWHLHFNEDGTFSQIMMSQNDKEGNQQWSIDAIKGEFSPDKGWILHSGVKTTWSGNVANAPESFKKKALPEIKDNPFIMRDFHNLSGLSLSEINRRKNSEVQFSKDDIQVMDVKFYALLFTPFACMISVLLGIPLSITQQRTGALASASKALGIMIAYYILLHVFMNFGNTGLLPPFIAGSFPTLFFLAVGVFVSLKK